MRILMLTPYLPFPLLSGGQIRTYNLLRLLSRKHSITLFSFIRNPSEESSVSHLTSFCDTVLLFQKRSPWSFSSLSASAVTIYPLVVCMYLKRSLRLAISSAIRTQRFDLIHAETFYVMPNIPDSTIPIILVEQTIEHLVYEHYTKHVAIPPLKWLMHYDVWKIRYWEKTFWKKARHVVAMSDADRMSMKSLVPDLPVDLVPNGVDTDFFSFRPAREKPKKQTVIFVGNFKWLQNREAVSVLVKRVWPRIQKQIGSAVLWIVGRFPTHEITQFVSPSIRVSCDIDDIRTVYRHASVLLAPIYGPGGTRYKILESMAAGVPVVTTPTGIEGIGAQHRKDVLIGSTPDELARETLTLLSDDGLYERLVGNGRALIVARFSWDKIADILDTIYSHAVYENR